MSMDAAHKSWWQIFEVVFGVPFLAAILLQWLVPLSLPRGFRTPVGIFAGGVCIVSGVSLVILARREFAKQHQPTDPGHSTSAIITTGVFSISRNPLYLGGVCALVGTAVVFNWPWVLVFLIPAWVACHYILIVPEEKYLTAKFGAEYRMYASAVHRWIGRARRSKQH